jgi:hypothetical protein
MKNGKNIKVKNESKITKGNSEVFEILKKKRDRLLANPNGAYITFQTWEDNE